MTLDSLKWDAAGLVTVIVQERHGGMVRMVAHANREALEATLHTGDAHFFSRSRGKLWRKGEESGNVIRVREVWADCDGDAIVYLADPEGPSCHTGKESCFFARLDGGAGGDAADARPSLERLFATLEARRDGPAERSYTRSLLDGGAPKIGAKINEEAGELVRALEGESDERVVSEAADLVYHALVGLVSRRVSLRALEAELGRRHGRSGLEEKAARPPKGAP